MPTSLTVTSVYNMALDMIAEAPLSSTAGVNDYARWLNRNYSPVVEAALRANPWNFACEYHQLNASVDVPAFRWKTKYDLPNLWLRVLPLTISGYRGAAPVSHEVKGNALYANTTSALNVELVMNKQDPGEWDPLFATYVAAKLAHGMAHRFVRKTTFVQLCAQQAQQAYDQAELIDAFEGTPDLTEQHDIIRVRY